MPEPARARPIFCSQDFALLRTAVAEYVRAHDGEEGIAKFVNLHHRLGRLGR